MRTAIAICEILVRRLLRQKRDLKQEGTPPNEFVFTDEYFYVAAKAYRRKCHIEFFSSAENVTISRLQQLPSQVLVPFRGGWAVMIQPGRGQL